MLPRESSAIARGRLRSALTGYAVLTGLLATNACIAALMVDGPLAVPGLAFERTTSAFLNLVVAQALVILVAIVVWHLFFGFEVRVRRARRRAARHHADPFVAAFVAERDVLAMWARRIAPGRSARDLSTEQMSRIRVQWRASLVVLRAVVDGREEARQALETLEAEYANLSEAMAEVDRLRERMSAVRSTAAERFDAAFARASTSLPDAPSREREPS